MIYTTSFIYKKKWLLKGMNNKKRNHIFDNLPFTPAASAIRTYLGGVTWSKYPHCGPFNEIDPKAVTSELDAICYQHDIDYGIIGEEAYTSWNWADQKLLDRISAANGIWKSDAAAFVALVFQLKKSMRSVIGTYNRSEANSEDLDEEGNVDMNGFKEAGFDEYGFNEATGKWQKLGHDHTHGSLVDMPVTPVGKKIYRKAEDTPNDRVLKASAIPMSEADAGNICVNTDIAQAYQAESTRPTMPIVTNERQATTMLRGAGGGGAPLLIANNDPNNNVVVTAVVPPNRAPAAPANVVQLNNNANHNQVMPQAPAPVAQLPLLMANPINNHPNPNPNHNLVIGGAGLPIPIGGGDPPHINANHNINPNPFHNSIRKSLYGSAGKSKLSSYGDVVHFQGSEFVGIVRGNALNTTFKNRARHINPGLREEFPMMSQIAQCFEQYRFDELEYTFVTTCSSLSTQNQTTGTITMGTQYNTENPDFESLDEILACQHPSAGPVNMSFRRAHAIACSSKSISGPAIKNVRTGKIPAASAGHERNRYDHCKLNIVVADTPYAANAGMDGLAIGQLFVKYKVAFYKPRLWGAIGKTITTHALTQTNGGQVSAVTNTTYLNYKSTQYGNNMVVPTGFTNTRDLFSKIEVVEPGAVGYKTFKFIFDDSVVGDFEVVFKCTATLPPNNGTQLTGGLQFITNGTIDTIKGVTDLEQDNKDAATGWYGLTGGSILPGGQNLVYVLHLQLRRAREADSNWFTMQPVINNGDGTDMTIGSIVMVSSSYNSDCYFNQ